MKLRFDTLPKGIIPKARALLRSYFFGGLLVVVPLGAIAAILAWFIGTLWGLGDLLPNEWQPSEYIDDSTLALGVKTLFVLVLAVLLALGVSIVGWASKQILGRKVLEFLAESVIQRIPLVRSIYSALDQLLRTLAAGGGQQFSRVVYVEYPRAGCWSLAFVTGAAKGPNVPPSCLNIFIPTTPNPTSGFHLIVPESQVRDSGMKVEEAFRTLLSLGIAQPTGAAPKDGRE